MKTIKKQYKLIALVLSMLILFQGCTVYRSVSISLEQAVQNESKVRVKTNSNKKLKFKRIGNENGTYYGVKKSNGVIVKTPLDHNIINSINEKDKTLSTILSIGIPVIIVGGLIAVAGAGFGSVGISGPLFPPGFF
jgi:hypothetical protein